MKMKIFTTIGTILLSLTILNSATFAASSTGSDVGEKCTYDYNCQPNLVCANKKCTPTIDALTSRPGQKDKIKENYPETTAVANLPNVTLESAMSEVILLILRVSMLLTIIAIVVAAIYYIISRGKEEDITKAKDIILYLVIGIAIMAAAYGIVSGIAQFDFFK